MSSFPLAGVRILSLAEQYPGPYATMLLADLGADVILVERPAGGDPSRRFPGLFASLNRNKRSVVLNLKSPDGKDRFLQLVDTADVVVEGYRPGAMQRLGLDAAILRGRKPSLICASISSFGQQGPLSAVAGHDLSIQAAAGMVKVPTGQESRGSVPVLPMADIASGMFAAFGILAGLYARSQDNSGRTLDVSMLDALVSWMTPFLVPPINGMPLRDLPPLDPGYGIFSTRDGRQITLSIAGEDAMWSSLCQLLALEEYAGLKEAERNRRVDEIDPVLRKALAGWELSDLYCGLESRGIAFGPVIEAADVLKEPQLLGRGIVAQDVGPRRQTFVRQPVLFDGRNFPVKRPAPTLGEHTQEILASMDRTSERVSQGVDRPTNRSNADMNANERMEVITHMIRQAHTLAADDHVMVRVAGERVAVILADLVYEIDTDRAEVFSLLPTQRRD